MAEVRNQELLATLNQMSRDYRRGLTKISAHGVGARAAIGAVGVPFNVQIPALEDFITTYRNISFRIGLAYDSAASMRLTIRSGNTAVWPNDIVFNALQQPYIQQHLGWNTLGFAPPLYLDNLLIEKNAPLNLDFTLEGSAVAVGATLFITLTGSLWVETDQFEELLKGEQETPEYVSKPRLGEPL